MNRKFNNQFAVAMGVGQTNEITFINRLYTETFKPNLQSLIIALIIAMKLMTKRMDRYTSVYV